MHDDPKKHMDDLMSEWWHSMQRTIKQVKQGSKLPPYINDGDLQDAAIKAFYESLVNHDPEHSSGKSFEHYLKDRIKNNILSVSKNKPTTEKVEGGIWDKLKSQQNEALQAKMNPTADESDAVKPDLPPQAPAEVKTFGPDSPEVQEANLKLKQQQTPKE